MKRERAHRPRQMRIGLFVMMLLLASCGESHETAGPSMTPPSVPQGVVAEASSCSEITITWSASTASGSADLEEYRVFRDGALLGTVVAPSTAMSDSGLDESTTYSYQVSAVDTAGNESDRSAEVQVTTPACPDPNVCTPLSLYALPSPPSYVYDGWRTRAEQEALWNELWEAHELGDRVRAIGQSEQGRDIWLFECGQPTADVILMDAQMHGNEDHPFEVMLMLADWLLGSCEPEALHILENNRVMFIPSVNPDQANQDDGNTFTRWNANHVNLNRNFVHNWSSAGSSDPTADDYRGP